MKPLVLTWDHMPHTFVIRQMRGVLMGTFTIRKRRGIQRIRVPFPRGVSLTMIRNAWNKQRCRWLPVAEPPHSPFLFLAARKIRLPKYQILWYVLHIDDAPYDACSVLPLKAAKPKKTKQVRP